MNEEETERHLALFDFEGKRIGEPIKGTTYTVSGAYANALSLNVNKDGTFWMESAPESRKYSFYNKEGALILSPDTLTASGYAGEGIFTANGMYVDIYGRVLIAGVTYLPFQ